MDASLPFLAAAGGLLLLMALVRLETGQLDTEPWNQLNLYLDQPDKALDQFNRSLNLEPKHAKTLLNVGIVKAFGKQDLQGAAAAWQEVLAIAPDSQEAQAAKRALDSLQSAHPAVGSKPGL